MQRVTLPYPPTANKYWRMLTIRGQARMVVSKEAKEYRKTVAELAFAFGMRPMSGTVAVRLAIFRPKRLGDLDNTLKVILDGLKGVAYQDDSQIVRIEASRFDDKNNPRVEFEIEPATSQKELI